MQIVMLYQYRDDDIRISVEAYFEGVNLVIDGYDIGKRVKEYWGDTDYEYMLTIPPQGVAFLRQHLHVQQENQEALLEALSKTFNTNTCYSDIEELLRSNNIPCSGFTWT